MGSHNDPKGGHSILVHVLDFQHYFYYPAPQGFTKDDLQSLRNYLNVSFGAFVTNNIYRSQVFFWLTQILIPSSAQWLTNLDTENVAVAPNGPPLTFLKFIVSDHRKIQQLRDECSQIKSATTGTKSPFIRVFISGKCQYQDLFTDPQSSYEGKVPYHLRFMIDNEVSV